MKLKPESVDEIDPIAAHVQRGSGMKGKKIGLAERLTASAMVQAGIHPIEVGNTLGIGYGSVKTISEEDSLNPTIVSKIKSVLAGKFYLLSNFILDKITETKLEAMSAYQLVGMASMLYDKARLADGLSTQNLAVRTLAVGINADMKQVQEMKARLLASIPPQSPTVVPTTKGDPVRSTVERGRTGGSVVRRK